MTREALRGLFKLARQNAHDVMNLPDVEKALQQVVKSFPGDPEILSDGYSLLNMKEECLALPQKPPFEYPPFQRALPYFPSNGYQLMLTFKQKLTPQLQKQIKLMLQALKGEVGNSK